GCRSIRLLAWRARSVGNGLLLRPCSKPGIEWRRRWELGPVQTVFATLTPRIVLPRPVTPAESAAETVEGRRPIGGKVSSDACPGLSTGTGMPPKRRAYGSAASTPAITSDLR